MKHIVVGEQIIKTFGTGSEQTRVLDGVSAAVAKGEFVAVMGPSGSGKTTQMFALRGMDTVAGGKVPFDGQELAALKGN